MTSGGVIAISWERLSFVALTLVVLLYVVRRLRLGLEREVLVSSLRGSVQLLAVGYVLTALFAVRRPELVLAVLLVMFSVAARTASQRLAAVRGLAWIAGASLSAGTGLCIVFMATVIVQPSPWYDPQYVVPITGMLLGNAMTGVSLAGERFQEELSARRGEVEARLALGFPGDEAVHPLVQRAMRAALIPTLNSFAVAGVVQLPGMMTGQILSGVHPPVAVRYQILIFFLLMTATAISTHLFLVLLRGRYVNAAHQLVQTLPAGARPLGSRRTDKNK